MPGDTDNAQRALAAMVGRIAQAVPATTAAVANEVHRRISSYPPATEANRPPAEGSQRRGWYQRGYGPRWRRGKRVGGRRSSEMLGRKWLFQRRGTAIVLSNAASYAQYVHGAKDQPEFHARRGWRTDEDVRTQMENDGTIRRIATLYLRKALRGG